MAVMALPMAYSMGSSIPLVRGALYSGEYFGDQIASPISRYRDYRPVPLRAVADIIDYLKTTSSIYVRSPYSESSFIPNSDRWALFCNCVQERSLR